MIFRRLFIRIALAATMTPLIATSKELHTSQIPLHEPLKWESINRALAIGDETSQVTLVFFHAEWCGPCRLVESEILPQLRPLLDQMVLAKVDLGDNTTHLTVNQSLLTGTGIARLMGISSTPSFVLIAPDGKPILRETGLINVKALGILLAYATTGAYRHDSFEEYAKATRWP